MISTAGRHIAIDPSGNIDETLHDPASTEAHQAAYAAAFAAAGIPIETIDTVLLSHIESIGLSAVSGAGGWRPFFPNARLLMSDRAHQSFVDHPPDGQLQEALRTLSTPGRSTPSATEPRSHLGCPPNGPACTTSVTAPSTCMQAPKRLQRSSGTSQ